MKFIPFVFLMFAFTVAVAAETPPGHPPVDHKTMTKQLMQNESSDAMDQQGKVVTAISVESGYIYLEVDPDEGEENIWIALPDQVQIKEGDTVRYKNGPVMKDFESKSLNRTFPSVMFLSNVQVVSNNQ